MYEYLGRELASGKKRYPRGLDEVSQTHAAAPSFHKLVVSKIFFLNFYPENWGKFDPI